MQHTIGGTLCVSEHYIYVRFIVVFERESFEVRIAQNQLQGSQKRMQLLLVLL